MFSSESFGVICYPRSTADNMNSMGNDCCIPHSRCNVGDFLSDGSLIIQVKIDLLEENCQNCQDQTGLAHKLDEHDMGLSEIKSKLDKQNTELSEMKSKLDKQNTELSKIKNRLKKAEGCLM